MPNCKYFVLLEWQFLLENFICCKKLWQFFCNGYNLVRSPKIHFRYSFHLLFIRWYFYISAHGNFSLFVRNGNFVGFLLLKAGAFFGVQTWAVFGPFILPTRDVSLLAMGSRWGIRGSERFRSLGPPVYRTKTFDVASAQTERSGIIRVQ